MRAKSRGAVALPVSQTRATEPAQRKQDLRSPDQMRGCGKDLTRACTIDNLRKMENFDVGGIVAPLSFNNELQLSGTAVAICQLDAKTKTFTQKTDFLDY